MRYLSVSEAVQLSDEFAEHDFTTHGKDDYVRGNVYTNTIEGCFSIFKRGVKGVYQHCDKQYLHRYEVEFEFRYNYRIGNGFGDVVRANKALQGIVGKRVMYRNSSLV